ncbi:hypothetical protein Droror1_Dr00016679 [Drosera rotundifolia]
MRETTDEEEDVEENERDDTTTSRPDCAFDYLRFGGKMQLRSGTQLHFVSAIKQGEVKKVPNIARGKPVLKFKGLEDIHDAQVSVTDASPVTKGAKARWPGRKSHMNAQIKVKEEEDAVGDKSDSFLDDFSTVTLKQMKEECKAKKKRKASSSVKRGKRNLQSSSPLKQECVEKETISPLKQERVESEPNEDELDLDETLNSWKRRKLSRVSPGAASAASMSDEIQGDKGIEPCMEEVMTPSSSKLEATNTHCLTSQVKTLPSDDSLSGGNPGLSSAIIQRGLNVRAVLIWLKMLDVTTVCTSQEQDLSLNKESQYFSLREDCLAASKSGHNCSTKSDSSVLKESHACELNQVSCDHLEDGHASSDPVESTDSVEIVDTVNLAVMEVLQQADGPDQMTSEVSPNEGQAEAEDPHLANIDSSVSEESHACEFNQVPYDHPEKEHEFSQNVGNSEYEEHSSEHNDDSIDSYFPVCNVPTNSPTDAKSTCLVGEVQDLQICHNDELDQTIYAYEAAVVSDISSDNSDHVSSCDTIEISSQPSFALLEVNPSNCDTTMTTKRGSSTSDNSDAPERTFPICHPGETTDEDSESPSDGSCTHIVQQTPKRMLSGRKIISPNSQEELCTLMNSADLDNEAEAHKCKKKLSFDKPVESTVQLAEPEIENNEVIHTPSTECANTAKITNNSVKTKKVGNKFSGCRESVRTTKTDQESPRFSSGCNSIQSCSRSAVTFSQQQMHDFGRLASKLTTKLQSMKDILVDVLQQEAKTFATARYNINEARVAVEHAAKLRKRQRSGCP